MKDEKFLEDFINSYSPSGSENDSQQKWVDYVGPNVDEISVDNYGNAVATMKSNENFKVALSAHVDEVSYRVSYIGGSGLINVIKNGNPDHQVAPGSRVKIHTDNGLVDGVFGWPSVNTRIGDKETTPSIENIFIDCGVGSKKEVHKLGVRVGCTVTYPYNFMRVGNYYTGKSFDNKIGGYVLTQVIKNIKDNKIKHNSDILFINTIQEEVGTKGSQIICNKYKPDIAITIDATHDTNTPMMNKKKYGDIICGAGPVIIIGPTIHPKLVKMIEEVAKKGKTPYQIKAITKTSTDAESYMLKGVTTALVSIPLKYMHNKVEMVHENDVINTILLLTRLLKSLDPEDDFSFFKK